jgi:hypothetical protein
MKLTGDDLQMLFHGLANDVGSNVGVYNVDKENELLRKEDLVTKQILDNQEKAEQLDSYHYEKQVGKLQQEIKQFKEDYNLLNKVNESHIDELAEFDEENINLEQKLEKIKELLKQSKPYDQNLGIKLKAILEENK